MDVVESNETFSKKPTVDDAEANTLLPCCKHTIDQHAAFNAMMVCSECKQIIKCFSDEKAYTNYQRFCASRHRKILATVYEGTHVVVFSSYDTYST
ncbi:MAG: hypothetical protein HRU19_25415 [Pseudobacteriovorax sp.]|nr:hypothetical protein [Pseudobacteriovorax sp.]